MDKQPKITIITVVFNGIDLLAGTIQSVFAQTYPNIEYLIIDGNSNDGTLKLIKENEDKITKWISEPDKGLYDAMNKGIKLATGDFLWFMNAGDRIFSNDTVEKMVAAYTPKTDILFGEVMLVNENREYLGTRSEVTTQRLPEKLKWQSLKYGMCVCHQAFLPKREIVPLYALDNLSADIEWVIRCLKKAQEATPSNLILAEYLAGGLSKKRHKEGLNGRYAILQEYYGFIPNILNHFIIIIRAVLHKIRRIGKTHY
jgi:glycosyltransferase involved in cell wall biosynthesis